MNAVRTIDETKVPATGTWRLDPGHADVGFVGRHLGLTKVRGRFTGVSGTVTIADDLAASTVDVAIDMATVNSGDQSRDDHLRSGDFFDVDNHPTATFRSTRLDVKATAATLVGELTMKGITRPVTLEVDYLGHASDPWGNERAVFSASGRINREDWGLTWNMLLEAGGLLVSKEIVLQLDVELIQATDS